MDWNDWFLLLCGDRLGGTLRQVVLHIPAGKTRQRLCQAEGYESQRGQLHHTWSHSWYWKVFGIKGSSKLLHAKCSRGSESRAWHSPRRAKNTDTSPGPRGESSLMTPSRFPWKTQLGLESPSSLKKCLVPHVAARKNKKKQSIKSLECGARSMPRTDPIRSRHLCQSGVWF